MFGKGLYSIIAGILIIGFGIWMNIDSGSSIQEANNIRENGYYYDGTSNITADQFEHIKQYKGFHSGEVEVISISPLSITYSFGTLEDLPYLNKIEWSFTEKTMKPAVSNILPMLLYLIGILAFLNGVLSLGYRGKDNNDKEH